MPATVVMDPLYVTGTVPPQEVRVVSSPGVPTWFLYAAGAAGALALGFVVLGAVRTPSARGPSRSKRRRHR